MKLILMSIVCLLFVSVVVTEETKKITSDNDELDVVKLVTDDTKTEKSESPRKRDSGYIYARPDRPTRYETAGIRGRIVTRYPSGPTSKPFTIYGPPKQTRPQFSHPSDQYAPQHSYVVGQRQQQHRRPNPQQNEFSSHAIKFVKGQMDQEVPNPTRNYDFVEPSPIASQNNEPFNSNTANYLPPRNQKLPGYLNSHEFSNDHRSTIIPTRDRFPIGNDNQQQQQQQQQNVNGQHQSQAFVQSQFQDQQQISDAAIFLTQNAQAISQLYEAPATNLNYEPVHESSGSLDQSQNPNNQFQTFDVNDVASQRLRDSHGFQTTLPSYASGFLNSDRNAIRIQSLQKDRLIAQLQQALARGSGDGSTNSRYVENHGTGGFVDSQSLLAAFGTQIKPSVGSQLDNSNGYDGSKQFEGENTGFLQSAFLPDAGTTASGLSLTYGLPSAAPTVAQSPSTTTVSTTTLASTQRPDQGFTSDGSNQVGTSVTSPGTSLTFPLPQYGGFVPTILGTNILTGYPAYGTNFLSSNLPNQTPIQSSGSSPTHFGIPIPTIPSSDQGTTNSFGPTVSTKPQTPFHGHPRPSTPIHTIPLQPIQPIHPIPATPVHHVFPVAPPPPSVTQIHPIQNHVPGNSGHPAYGFQSALINPLLVKPAKGIYPVYYYPNVYPAQKPNAGTLPWGYAPAYASAKPQQIWK